MKHYSRLLWLAFFALVIVVGLLLVPGAAKPVLGHPSRVIDNFGDDQQVIQSGIGTKFEFTPTAGSSSNIIGGQREVSVTVTATGAENEHRVTVNGGGLGNLAHSQGSGVRGRTTIVYDGTTDGGAAGVDATTGFGPYDFTSGGDNAIVLLITGSDAQGKIAITLYSSASACSTVEKTMPSGINIDYVPRAIVFKHSSFSSAGAGCSSSVSLNSVRAISVTINSGGNPILDWDVSLKLIENTQLDYGDLPNGTPQYNSITTGENAAGHVISTLRMGSLIDSETNGQQNTSDALKDDQTTSDDEDGVGLLGTKWNAGGTNQVRVVANGNGCVAAWIDWNNDGDFDDSGENIIANASVISGNNDITFNVPSGIPEKETYYSRFRLYERDADNTCTTEKYYQYQAYNGEVEDHSIGYRPTAVTMNSLTANAEPANPLVPIVGVGVVGTLGALGVFVLRRRRN